MSAELQRCAERVAGLEARTVLIEGTALYGKLCIAIRALVLKAQERPGLYLVRGPDLPTVEALAQVELPHDAKGADCPDVRRLLRLLLGLRAVTIGQSRVRFETIATARSHRELDGAVLFYGGSYSKHLEHIADLSRACVGPLIVPTFTDTRDLWWLERLNPYHVVAHTSDKRRHARVLALDGHKAEHHYFEGFRMTPLDRVPMSSTPATWERAPAPSFTREQRPAQQSLFD